MARMRAAMSGKNRTARAGVLGTLAALLATLPAPASPASATRLHEVYPGQTLGMIAKRYNISIDELCKLNGITRRTPIKPGQKLKVPADEDDADDRPTRTASLTTAAPQPAAAQPAPPRASSAPPRSRPAGSRPESYARKPARRGWVTLIGTTGDFVGFVLDRKGRVLPAARTGFDRALGSWRTGQHTGMDERLIQLVAQVSDHFGGRSLRAISGYRPYSPQQFTAHSRHNTGEAMDFSIPGVPNTVVRDYLKTLGAVGVGYYPSSSFVHLDVRPAPTYWVDYSRPGEAPRYAGLDGKDPGSAPPAAASPGSAGASVAGGGNGAGGAPSAVAGSEASSASAPDPGH